MKININTIPDEGLELREIKGRNWLPGALAGEAAWDFSLEEVIISCNIKKVDKTIFLRGAVETTVHTACSRCLETASLPVNATFRYTLVPTAMEGREEIELTAEDLEYGFYEGETVDCDPLIYEQIVLQIPMKALCREDCRGLCPRCGANLNLSPCSCPDREVDARLAVLKQLKRQ
ncbi:MAG: DUF177 domain-containing protein [Pseudomonadota bacterium]|nr:DUF177 domain-containing protein [Pseudomonadota bacterium]